MLVVTSPAHTQPVASLTPRRPDLARQPAPDDEHHLVPVAVLRDDGVGGVALVRRERAAPRTRSPARGVVERRAGGRAGGDEQTARHGTGLGVRDGARQDGPRVRDREAREVERAAASRRGPLPWVPAGGCARPPPGPARSASARGRWSACRPCRSPRPPPRAGRRRGQCEVGGSSRRVSPRPAAGSPRAESRSRAEPSRARQGAEGRWLAAAGRATVV